MNYQYWQIGYTTVWNDVTKYVTIKANESFDKSTVQSKMMRILNAKRIVSAVKTKSFNYTIEI